MVVPDLLGSRFVDQTVVPGQISYYGFYILGANSQWIRSGFTACLMPVNHGYADLLWSYLPEYLRDVQDNELTADRAVPACAQAPQAAPGGA